MDDAPNPQHVTRWLAAWRHGDERARDQLFAAVYPQSRRIASRFLQHERGDHTLDPTALVNELALRLLGSVEEWQPAPQSEDMLMLDEALSKLEQADARAAKATGFRGPHKSRSVKGHEFGLKLSAEERRALIAFLRTL